MAILSFAITCRPHGMAGWLQITKLAEFSHQTIAGETE
jgi:hypothetical protein